uniref:5'-deoxynucleotidase HDDC2 n=1 Tax=Phallusia mammillata TaxID=59560 RepID=A0A6F9DF79_9ASCI|nr:HD domain-containing protein 2-like [Phallusia mammillata]
MAENLVQFLSTIGKLKKTERAGWVLKGIKHPESVSDHMYRMAIMAMTCLDSTSEIKMDHCIKLCLVHDMAECIVGDITPSDNITKEEKQRLEKDAMDHLGSLLPKETSSSVKELFEEYEAQETREAMFVKDLDRFEMILQAFEYETERDDPGFLQEFFDSVEGKIRSPSIRKLAESLIKTRQKKEM